MIHLFLLTSSCLKNEKIVPKTRDNLCSCTLFSKLDDAGSLKLRRERETLKKKSFWISFELSLNKSSRNDEAARYYVVSTYTLLFNTLERQISKKYYPRRNFSSQKKTYLYQVKLRNYDSSQTIDPEIPFLTKSFWRNNPKQQRPNIKIVYNDFLETSWIFQKQAKL